MPKKTSKPQFGSREIRRALDSLGLQAKKSLGQHFLVGGRVSPWIINAAELSPNDTVIEVGAGLGNLTQSLARKAGKILAIEIDVRLASALRRVLAKCPNVEVIQADILQIDLNQLLADSENYKVVANLPYYITSPVLRYFLEASHKPSRMVVMVQKEVAETIVAPPGKMSLLSVSVQFYGKPSIVAYVPAGCFFPPPEVDSAILCIELGQQPSLEVTAPAEFFRVVRGGFTAPRKQLRNSLAQGLGLSNQEATAWLTAAGIDPRRRAESLELQEWAKVLSQFQNLSGG
jgi:16S rRNA (adenine1518-N6/adenine1519-N6)-dimethyltransferase